MNDTKHKTIAVIGASTDRTKFGNKAVRGFAAQGHTIYPVNPRATEIEGLTAYASIREVPSRPDMVTMYLPAALVLKALPEIAERGCDELWLNPGTESEEVIAEAKRLGLTPIVACSLVGHDIAPSTI